MLCLILDIKFKEDVPQHHDDDQLPMSDLPTLDSAVIQPEDVPPSSDAVVYQPSVPDRQSRLIAVEAQLSLFDQQLQAIEATARHVEKEYGQAGQVEHDCCKHANSTSWVGDS